MGKNDLLKGSCKPIKFRGLQKLRWYCQMCEKQCRDANGFKCHCMSESHHRQMQVFGEKSQFFIDSFSQEFEACFLEHVKRSHRFGRVAATVLYNEYISDRHHIHMNATQWTSLTNFVTHLGRTGKCNVDDTEKGWFVTYIDREPETLLRERLKNKRKRADFANEDRHEKAIEQQIDRATKNMRPTVAHENPNTEDKKILQRNGEDRKVVFAFTPQVKVTKESEETDVIGAVRAGEGVRSVFLGGALKGFEQRAKQSGGARDHDGDMAGNSNDAKLASAQGGSGKTGVPALARLMEDKEKAKEKANRSDYWLVEGLVVKVMSRSLAKQGFYKQKGVVRRVIVGKYVAEIKMLESGAILKVDQEELETVLPQIGGIVKIVNGACKGSIGKLLSIDTVKFTAKVQVEKGIYDGRVLNAVEYEDICKISTSS